MSIVNLYRFPVGYLHRPPQLGKPARFAAGDKDLAGGDLVQHEILPLFVQLGQDIVQQQQGLFAKLPLHELSLGQLQADGCGAGLALRAIGLQINAGKGDGKVVFVGARQALAGLELRPVVGLQMGV